MSTILAGSVGEYPLPLSLQPITPLPDGHRQFKLTLRDGVDLRPWGLYAVLIVGRPYPSTVWMV